MNNQVNLIGCVTSGFTYDHEVHSEKFFRFSMEINRESGTTDIVPIIVSDRLVDTSKSIEGKYVLIEGQFRSYNKHETDRNKLMLYVFATEVIVLDYDIDELNEVFIEGYLVKPPVYRVTPLGREIADILVAVNRRYGKTDYIPCICWGRMAKYCRNMTTGDRVMIDGRFQSRDYQKNGEQKTAYELSASSVIIA